MSAGDWTPSDADLAQLLAFVRGNGFIGPGLTSYPLAKDDENQQRIHATMLILEARGLVRRHHVCDKGAVTWAPIETEGA